LEEFGLIWPQYAAIQRYLRNLVRNANNSQSLGVHTHFCGRCRSKVGRYIGR